MKGSGGIPQYRVTAIKLGNIRGGQVDHDLPVGCGNSCATSRSGPRQSRATGSRSWSTRVSAIPRGGAPWRPPGKSRTRRSMPLLPNSVGASPTSISAINSHLHWDHSDNNRRLPNARFYVSLAEWEYAKSPISIQKKLYIHDWSSAPLSIMNYVLVNQDLFEVVPGIKTIETPGHSAGHQSILHQHGGGDTCVWPVTRPASWRT